MDAHQRGCSPSAAAAGAQDAAVCEDAERNIRQAVLNGRSSSDPGADATRPEQATIPPLPVPSPGTTAGGDGEPAPTNGARIAAQLLAANNPEQLVEDARRDGNDNGMQPRSGHAPPADTGHNERPPQSAPQVIWRQTAQGPCAPGVDAPMTIPSIPPSSTAGPDPRLGTNAGAGQREWVYGRDGQVYEGNGPPPPGYRLSISASGYPGGQRQQQPPAPYPSPSHPSAWSQIAHPAGMTNQSYSPSGVNSMDSIGSSQYGGMAQGGTTGAFPTPAQAGGDAMEINMPIFSLGQQRQIEIETDKYWMFAIYHVLFPLLTSPSGAAIPDEEREKETQRCCERAKSLKERWRAQGRVETKVYQRRRDRSVRRLRKKVSRQAAREDAVSAQQDSVIIDVDCKRGIQKRRLAMTATEVGMVQAYRRRHPETLPKGFPGFSDSSDSAPSGDDKEVPASFGTPEDRGSDDGSPRRARLSPRAAGGLQSPPPTATTRGSSRDGDKMAQSASRREPEPRHLPAAKGSLEGDSRQRSRTTVTGPGPHPAPQKDLQEVEEILASLPSSLPGDDYPEEYPTKIGWPPGAHGGGRLSQGSDGQVSVWDPYIRHYRRAHSVWAHKLVAAIEALREQGMEPSRADATAIVAQIGIGLGPKPDDVRLTPRDGKATVPAEAASAGIPSEDPEPAAE